MTAIQSDAAPEKIELGALTEDDAADEFLRRFMPPEDGADASKKKKPSAEKTDEEKTEPETTEDEEDDKSPAEKPEDKSDDEAEETDEEDDDEDGKAEVTIKVKVGDEEHEVPASELARLYGQEKALTKKSMEVAETRKTLEAKMGENVAAAGALLERAKARFEPFSKIDFNLLATQVSPEEYQALRQSAQAAWEDVQFLEKHTSAFMQQVKQEQDKALRTQAQEAIKVLSGPADKGGIEGWSEKLYGDIRAFAIEQGAEPDVINNIVQPWAIKLLHSAMLYERGKNKSVVKTVKVNKTPKKVTKTTSSPAVAKSEGNAADKKKAMDKLRRSGSTDDAADVFLSRWSQGDDD